MPTYHLSPPWSILGKMHRCGPIFTFSLLKDELNDPKELRKCPISAPRLPTYPTVPGVCPLRASILRKVLLDDALTAHNCGSGDTP